MINTILFATGQVGGQGLRQKERNVKICLIKSNESQGRSGLIPLPSIVLTVVGIGV